MDAKYFLKNHFIVCPQLNVPLMNSESLKWTEGMFKFEKNISFLENVMDIPNFPVLWIDLGADVESVRRKKLFNQRRRR